MKTNTNKENTKLLWQVTIFGVIAYIALYILKTATRYQEWKSEYKETLRQKQCAKWLKEVEVKSVPLSKENENVQIGQRIDALQQERHS